MVDDVKHGDHDAPAVRARAVVLNHTGYEHHHGCRAVMSTIYTSLAKRGVRVIAASPVRHKWWRNAGLMRAISKADVIVINGEGTLHHGAGHAERLLQVVDHPARRGAPVALINTLYQDNPSEWRRYLDRLALISARDGRSAGALKEMGYDAHLTPDLSLVGAAPQGQARRADVLGFGDSVTDSVSAELRRLYRGNGESGRFLPIWSSLRHWAFPESKPLLYALNAPSLLAAAADQIRDGRTQWYATERGFMAGLAGLGLYVTGRFHGATLALRSRTPCIVARSNSAKVEALVEDVGLDPRRIVDFSGMDRVDPSAWVFSAAESAAIEAYLKRAEEGASVVFDRIAALATARS